MQGGPRWFPLLVVASMLASVSGGGMAAGQELASDENACLVVCINEVMTNADGPDQGIFPQGEWVELYNSGSEESVLKDGR